MYEDGQIECISTHGEGEIYTRFQKWDKERLFSSLCLRYLLSGQGSSLLSPTEQSALLVLNKRVGVRLVLLGFPYLPTFLYFKVR